MAAAISSETEAQRAALAGDRAGAAVAFRHAAARYRASWECAPPASYGRLVGMLKAAILAGDGRREAAYVQRALGGTGRESPTAAYAQAIAALVRDDDSAARRWATAMANGSHAFAQTASAITALTEGNGPGYRRALEAIVRDLELRQDHLTGVAIADTALMLETLAGRRGRRAGVRSDLLPSGASSARERIDGGSAR